VHITYLFSDIQLAVAATQTSVQVNGDSDTDSGGDITTLNKKAVQELADPNDFLRQLQVLASAAGCDLLANLFGDALQRRVNAP